MPQWHGSPAVLIGGAHSRTARGPPPPRVLFIGAAPTPPAAPLLRNRTATSTGLVLLTAGSLASVGILAIHAPAACAERAFRQRQSWRLGTQKAPPFQSSRRLATAARGGDRYGVPAWRGLLAHAFENLRVR